MMIKPKTHKLHINCMVQFKNNGKLYNKSFAEDLLLSSVFSGYEIVDVRSEEWF